MDENEKNRIYLMLSLLGISTTILSVKLWFTDRKVNKTLDIVIEHIDQHFQDIVDDEFTNIVENYDD